MKNVQDQNFKPEIATQISVQLVPQPVSLNFFYLYAVNFRDRPRFFDQVGHQTTNVSISNKHFFTR